MNEKSNTELIAELRLEAATARERTRPDPEGPGVICHMEADEDLLDRAATALTGTVDQVIGYLDGPLRGDLINEDSRHRLDGAIALVRRGLIDNANNVLRGMSIKLRRPDESPRRTKERDENA